MSIYCTLMTLGIEEDDCVELIPVDVQAVPAHIDYTGPAFEWLPPPVPAELRDADPPHYRAVFFVGPWTSKGTPRCGQEYVDPLLAMTGEEYRAAKFADLMRVLAERVGQQTISVRSDPP